ncbi:YlzJ-like family protein [Cytobacillus sp. Hz8]|uniref:YlzJ-like family protein n=1 Tax=Cytobacillus sp. Hz8 TaxID=3347168 RepID=UPI0035D63684
MILYTMMPHDMIFPTNQDDFSKQKMVSFDGIPLLVEKDDQSQQYRVLRVLSSDPVHYLDGRCEPGSYLSILEVE